MRAALFSLSFVYSERVCVFVVPFSRAGEMCGMVTISNGWMVFGDHRHESVCASVGTQRLLRLTGQLLLRPIRPLLALVHQMHGPVGAGTVWWSLTII